MSVKALKPITPGKEEELLMDMILLQPTSLKRVYLLQRNVQEEEIARVK